MTKKDYIKLAKLIKDLTITIDVNEGTDEAEVILPNMFTQGLCDILQEDNPRFNKERFIAACK